MRKLLLFSFALFLFAIDANAQLNSCVPDPLYKDSLFGVFPRPYDPVAYPNGGINKSACIGKPYKFVFTGIIPDSLAVNLFGSQVKLKIDSLTLDKKDATTITGLPKGMNWDCGNKKYTFLPKSQNCVVVYGTATTANTPGNYEMKIKMKAYVQTLFGPTSQDVEFPGSLAPGTYTIKLEANNSPTCFVVGNEDQYLNVDKINAFPNPTTSDAKIIFSAKEADNFDFLVTDMSGKIIRKEKINVAAGWNEIQFNGSTLPEGIYIYYLGNEKGKIANRLTISK
jgi:hypothetical protein